MDLQTGEARGVYPAPPTDTDAREIPRTGDALAGQIERLRDAVDVLGQRLGPVLGYDPGVPTLDTVKAVEDLGSAVATRQQQFADQVEEQVNLVMGLTRRLQV